MGFPWFPLGGLRWFAALAVSLKAEKQGYPGFLGLSKLGLRKFFGGAGTTWTRLVEG